MNDATRGLHVNVFRSPAIGDCTLGGVSATHDGLTIVGILDETQGGTIATPMPDQCRAHTVSDNAPAVWLVKQNPCGRIDWYLRPVASTPGRSGKPMMGGNLAYTSDSRLSAIVGNRAGLPIHDRYEH